MGVTSATKLPLNMLRIVLAGSLAVQGKAGKKIRVFTPGPSL
jgi:hypothetical protein